MIKIVLFLLTFLFVPINTFSQQVDNDLYELSKKIVRSALIERKGYQWLEELCKIGPRLPGSENSYKAIQWAKQKMEEAGFDSVWLQPVMAPHWVRGNFEEAKILKSKRFKSRKLSITALGGSVGTDKNGITGEIIIVNNFEELKSKSDLVKGRIVFYNRPLDYGEVEPFAGYGGAVNQRSIGAIEAAKYGAIGVIVRSITTKHDNVPHTGVMNYVDSLPKIPAVAIGYQDADFLADAVLNEPDLQVNIKLSCKKLPDVMSYNVIGEIRGNEFPNEIIVVGGHFDSWDKGCGAHDDGAGCVQSMEVLDIFKRLNIKPKRTIRCVLFIDEEQSQTGAKEYAKFSQETNQKHIAAIEADRGAFTPRGFYADTDSSTLNYLQSFLPYLSLAKIDWIRKGGSGVDVSKIKNTKALFGYVPDSQRYMDVHHSDNDTFDTVHPREFELGSAAMAIMCLLLSEKGL
ncbi:MAG: M20/M25/M40 family metallo-hydrolase [Ignavibacteria bacterium]|nr:M20/M25/M40 family metallo-hydrolase [Ignavibacteria bacterium]